MADQAAAREALINRQQLPEMVMSDGSATSMTPPTPRMSSSLSPTERALKRFTVRGNAIVTGGTGNLAKEGARALLEHGISGLALCDVSLAQGTDIADEFRKEFPDAHVLFKQVDITNADRLSTVFQEIKNELGSIDVLVNFAGIVGSTHALEQSSADWQRILQVNTTGSFLCAQAAAKHMIAQGNSGSIVLIASMSGHIVNFPQPQAAYNASKSAVIHLARSLAAEWAKFGIRVNTISPGYMDTILNVGAGLDKAKIRWFERCPMGRMGSPPELTGPLVLLCSQWAGAYITGSDYVVDGGMLILN